MSQWFLPAGWCWAVVSGCGAGGQRGALLQGGSAGSHHGRSGGQSERHRPACWGTHKGGKYGVLVHWFPNMGVVKGSQGAARPLYSL